jgi:excisionase family DNA binding protein
MEDKQYYTYAEFAQLLGKTKQTIYRWVKTGTLRAARFSPKVVLIPHSELARHQVNVPAGD